MITQKLLHKELKYMIENEKAFQEADAKEDTKPKDDNKNEDMGDDPLTGLARSSYNYSDLDNPPKDPTPHEFDILEKLGVPGTDEDRAKYHETIRDTNETLKNLTKAGPDRFLKGAAARRGKKSIVGMASKNTFEFPVFVSKSIPLDYATAINSLLEQIYASYLQMAVTLNPIIDKKTALSGGPFSSFKTNITKYVEYTDMFYAHDAAHAYYEADDYTVEFNMISITDTEAKVINEAVEYQPLSEFSHFFQEAKHGEKWYQSEKSEDKLGNSTMTPSEQQRQQADAELENLYAENTKKTKEIANLEKEKEKLQHDLDVSKEMDPLKKEELEKRIKILQGQIDNAEDGFDKTHEELRKIRIELTADKSYMSKYGVERLGYIEEIINKRKKLIYDTRKSGLEVAKLLDEIERGDERWKMEREKHAKDMMVRGPQFMDETKIQKLNTMKPLMMTVQLKVVDTKGGISAPVEYVVGVKTHCRLVDPDILPDVVRYPLKKMDRLTRRAKWRAGEIKFFDYLFNIKEKKQTAVDAKDPKRKWYRRLYELAHKKGDANVAARISGNNSSGLIPNATIIMSQTDVDNIKAVTDINLLKGSSGRALCNELFLMSLIVVDMDSESIKILLPDIHNDYEIHSLASVKKQLATLDTAGDKARDMFKLLGR
jgi:hypothetical protein